MPKRRMRTVVCLMRLLSTPALAFKVLECPDRKVTEIKSQDESADIQMVLI